jgi:hypothetical protein
MLSQTISSELLADLSTDEQQLLAGGYGRYKRNCGCNGGVSSAGQESTPEPAPVPFRGGRLAIGFIITATPFSKCLNGYSGTNGGGSTSGTDD